MKSIKGKLNSEELKGYLINCLKFTAPILAIFFGELALKIDWRIAGLTASYAFYANLSDLFKKLGQGK
jgi:hypothetical protein